MKKVHVLINETQAALRILQEAVNCEDPEEIFCFSIDGKRFTYSGEAIHSETKDWEG